jgi:hemolysin activation/secretion protein
LVDVLPGRRVTGSIDADNAGNFYIGATNIGATINLNEPAGQGDVASLRLLTSGEGLNYFRASYQMHVGKARVGTAYSSLEYTLGQDFESLLANGTAKTTSFYGNYPLIRSPHRNLYVGLAYDSKRFIDRMDSVGSVIDKSARVLVASLSGDHRDTVGGGGDNNYSLTLTSGTINILTPGARAFDAASAQSNGRFNKFGFSANRLQSVSNSFTLFAGIRGQFASSNLDISEKMELGGMYGVRAYPEGEAFGDQGYLMTLEGRYQLPQWSQRFPGQMQLIGFVDAGSVKLNAKPWTLESNQRTLRAIGVGLNWWVSTDFVMQVIYARKPGGEPARSAPDASGRFWLRAVKYF